MIHPHPVNPVIQTDESNITGYPMIHPVNPVIKPDESESGQISDG
jgi:hypothetical protein